MRSRGLPLLLVLLWLTNAVHAAEEIPLEVHSGSLVVEATFNGRFTGRFLVDTGATYCVLGEAVARQALIKGRAGGTSIQLLTAKGPLRARLGEARRVQLGNSGARSVAVAVVKDNPVHGLDGILGLSFLQNFVYTVDAAAGILRLLE